MDSGRNQREGLVMEPASSNRWPIACMHIRGRTEESGWLNMVVGGAGGGGGRGMEGRWRMRGEPAALIFESCTEALYSSTLKAVQFGQTVEAERRVGWIGTRQARAS